MTNTSPKQYAELILPLPLAGTFSYEIPEGMAQQVKAGVRVEVEFGKRKHYSAVVRSIRDATHWSKTKPILAVIDDEPIVTPQQLQFWDWISHYYVCHLGEVMSAALPSAYKLESETRLYKLLEPEDYPESIQDDAYLLLEALELRHELSIQEAQAILQRKSILKLIHGMVQERLIQVREQLEEKSAVPIVRWIRLATALHHDPESFNRALDQVQRSDKQSRSLLSYLQKEPKFGWIRKNELQQISQTDSQVTDALIKKQIYEVLSLEKFEYPEDPENPSVISLSADQEDCLSAIQSAWSKHQTVLLHGITGSGKTQIYVQLIQEMLAADKQVLYLVPEIALTAQLVTRLKQQLGSHLLEYHSDLSVKSKVAVWNAALKQNRVFIGARSALFLPFHNLGMILVDEEHDPSYKQNDPAPRYQARDASIYLSRIFDARVLLGSATPSLESYYNAMQGKYALCNLHSRFGESELPEIQSISLKEVTQAGQMKGFFTPALLEEIQSQLDHKKQVIIFRNRRGYSPLVQCSNCNWEALCDRCDIRMTLHKQQQKLKCHICGNQRPIPVNCPDCGQHTLKILGFGTEKIEEELQQFFPDKVIRRLDLDVARSRSMQQKVIESFQDGEIDILVGTQMVTKGLDFDHVGLVGVLQADQILFYPDFRSQERGFQLLTQVGGRAGRRKDRGKVLIQGYQIHHPIIQQVLAHDHESFYRTELQERKTFRYPPFVRLINVRLLHLKPDVLDASAEILAGQLRALYGKRIYGPAEPHLSRIKGSYVREILIKHEKEAEMAQKIKADLLRLCQELKNQAGRSALRIHIDVDP